MSRLEIALFPGSVVHAPGETLLVLLPEDEHPPRGDAGLVDWRLQGEISQKLKSGYVSGAVGDAALIQGREPLQSKRILLLGVGASEPLRSGPDSHLTSLLQGASQRLAAIRSSDVLIALPEAIDLHARASALLRGLLQTLSGDADQMLRVVLPDASANTPTLEAAATGLIRDAHAQGIDLRVGWAAAPSAA